MPPLRPADDGPTQPTSPYDYHDMSLQDLRNALSVSPTGVKTVQDAWQQLSANMNNVLTGPAVSLEQALTLLKGWDSKLASKPFKDRAGQILDFGKQIASAAHQASEGFNDLSRTFHTSAWFLSMSIADMNSVHALAENALTEWSRDLYVLVGHLSRQTYGTSGINSSDTIGGFSGYATWEGVQNSPEINFQYLYGQGQKGSYPGIVQFSGQVRPQYSRVDITALAGPYGPKTLTNLIMYNDWSDEGWAGRTFSDTHRDQLANLLNQVAGGSYTPLVGQFPQLPQATWLTDGQGNGGSNNSSNNGGPGSVPGYTGGAAGTLPGAGLGSGSLGGTSPGSGTLGGTGYGTGGAGSPPATVPGTGPGTGSAGSAPGTGIGSFTTPGGVSAGQLGNPASVGIGTPTHLASYTPPASSSGGLGGLSSPGSFSSGSAGGLNGLGGGSLGTGGSLAGGSGSLAGTGGLGAGSAGGAAGEAATAAGLSAATGRSSMPMTPPMMPPQGGNQDRDRQRKSWLPEDEDIWGTDVDGVPPVISGDA
jgi:hypothetical protein